MSANPTTNKDTHINNINYKLTIATHNVQSISNHIKQNQLLQHMLLNNIDVLGISETNLKLQEAKTFHLHNNSDYTYFFSSNKEQPIGSGVGLIVKKNIAMHIFNHGNVNGRMIFIDIHSKGRQVLRII